MPMGRGNHYFCSSSHSSGMEARTRLGLLACSKGTLSLVGTNLNLLQVRVTQTTPFPAVDAVLRFRLAGRAVIGFLRVLHKRS